MGPISEQNRRRYEFFFSHRSLLFYYKTLTNISTVSDGYVPVETKFWICQGSGSCIEKRGYYLQFAEPNPVDINSSQLRSTLGNGHAMGGQSEVQINQLSTETLLQHLAPFL
jgi:hypothetical protein